MKKRSMTKEEKDGDYTHNRAAFDFWWRGDESQLRAIVEDAMRNEDDDFSKSMSAFAGNLALNMTPGSVPGPVPRFTSKTPMTTLDCILQLRGTAVKTSFDAFFAEDKDNYDPDRLEMDAMRNFRKTRTFTNNVVGVEYDSSHSVSPALKTLRVAEEEACGGGTEDTAKVIFRFLCNGETDSSGLQNQEEDAYSESSGQHSKESDYYPRSDSDKSEENKKKQGGRRLRGNQLQRRTRRRAVS